MDANQEKDAANKKCAAACKNNSLNINKEKSEKHGCTGNLCCHCELDGYNVTWTSCSHHNFCQLNYCQPSGVGELFSGQALL